MSYEATSERGKLPSSGVTRLPVSGRPEQEVAAGPRIAVLIPCYNEETAIPFVVRDFHDALPDADIYVYDNNSGDGTSQVASREGAIVRKEPQQGKGNVVRRMFADIEADVYILVDGDNTYDAASAPAMVERLLKDRLDMVSARRVTDGTDAFRPGHRFGNWLLTALVGQIFGSVFSDILSGYRVLSRRFVKSFPALSRGFEIETELTVHALELRMPVDEIEAPYRSRPSGSVSKLRTVHDGLRILRLILFLTKEERPLQLFTSIFAILVVTSILLGLPVVQTYLETGLVPRLPTALLAVGTMILAFLGLICGLILDSVTLGRREAKRMRYLQIPAPGAPSEAASQSR
jgi:hypothetical protein